MDMITRLKRPHGASTARTRSNIYSLEKAKVSRGQVSGRSDTCLNGLFNYTLNHLWFRVCIMEQVLFQQRRFSFTFCKESM